MQMCDLPSAQHTAILSLSRLKNMRNSINLELDALRFISFMLCCPSPLQDAATLALLECCRFTHSLGEDLAALYQTARCLSLDYSYYLAHAVYSLSQSIRSTCQDQYLGNLSSSCVPFPCLWACSPRKTIARFPCASQCLYEKVTISLNPFPAVLAYSALPHTLHKT